MARHGQKRRKTAWQTIKHYYNPKSVLILGGTLAAAGGLVYTGKMLAEKKGG